MYSWLSTGSALSWGLASLLGILALVALVRGMRRCRWSVRHAGHVDQSASMIRGIRSGIVGVALACFAVALWRGSGAWALFGAIFLAEELFETGVMLLATRNDATRRGRRSKGKLARSEQRPGA